MVDTNQDSTSAGENATPKRPMTPAERKKYIQELKAKKEEEKKSEEKRKKEEEREAKKKARAEKGGNPKLMIIIIVAVIVGILLGGGYYMYTQNPDMFAASESNEDAESAEMLTDTVAEVPAADTEKAENVAAPEKAKEIKDVKKKKDVKEEVIPAPKVQKGGLSTPCWIISYGSFKNKSYAEKSMANLQQKGLKAGIVWMPDYIQGVAELYKVYVGPFADKADAKAVLPEVQNLSPNAYFIHIK